MHTWYHRVLFYATSVLTGLFMAYLIYRMGDPV